ncbi:class I SAM-dependent methyltransferase [Acuticoccus kandeliae]|uniref:class I SAM-dependent methyltransferase n=1 Tax=Acuticoccus kandeliae TaxID=2073160 RepID=UPI001300AA21|nr:methyltransferase domain-containing protein [Acuticoccus kandeliae]
MLQFSDDPSVVRDGFAAFEVSSYGGSNHLDMADIDRDDASYDLVIANHVLEHVADDHRALGELARVSGPDGVVFLSVPDLLRVEETVEYGAPRADKHGHYRLYGPDIAARWKRAVPDWQAVGIVAQDPVTGAEDRATLLSRSGARLGALRDLLSAAGYRPFDAMA